jgi:hypothetical protein
MMACRQNTGWLKIAQSTKQSATCGLLFEARRILKITPLFSYVYIFFQRDLSNDEDFDIRTFSKLDFNKTGFLRNFDYINTN